MIQRLMERLAKKPKTKAQNLVDLLLQHVRKHPQDPFLYAKVNGTYDPSTYDAVFLSVEELALGLQQLGVEPNDKVALMAHNRPEWVISDLAIFRSRCCRDRLAYRLRSRGATIDVCFHADRIRWAQGRSSRGPDLCCLPGFCSQQRLSAGRGTFRRLYALRNDFPGTRPQIQWILA